MDNISIAPISIDDLAPALVADMDAPESEFTAHEYVIIAEDGFVDGNRSLHILHHAEAQRGGITLVGSGDSGDTYWTDAATPEEVVRRFLDDDMRP